MAGNRRCFATPAGIPLGRLTALPDNSGKPIRLDLPEGWFEGLLVRAGEAVFGYLDACPHAGVRLGRHEGDYALSGGRLQCCWHGARFAIESGRCVAGPCVGQSLGRWPVTVVDDEILTAGA